MILIIYTVTCHLNNSKNDNNDDNVNGSNHSINHKNRNRYNNEFDDDIEIISSSSQNTITSQDIIDVFKQYFDLLGQKVSRKVNGWVKKNANMITLPTDEDIYRFDVAFGVEHDDSIDQIPKTLEWGGVRVSDAERSALVYVRIMREKLKRSSSNEYGSSSWLFTASDKELLRFVRGQIAHKEDAWKAILAHAKWRNSKYGADKVGDFSNNFMHYEIFWLGLNKQGCPTMVVRTVAHDGAHYNEDPELFTAFFTSLLEKGRHLYGVAAEKQVCMILDRFPFDLPDSGITKKEDEKFDFAVIKNLLNLFQHLYTTLINHYPEILDHARVMPASWVFKACYKITSRVMDKNNRKKFRMVSHSDVNKEMSSLFRQDMLPEHFGGTAQLYGGLPASKSVKQTWNNVASVSTVNSNNNYSIQYKNMLRGAKDNNDSPSYQHQIGEVSVVAVTADQIGIHPLGVHPSFNNEFYPAI